MRDKELALEILRPVRLRNYSKSITKTRRYENTKQDIGNFSMTQGKMSGFLRKQESSE